MSKRYFNNESKVKPGVISDELRRALNIHRDKLPIWIYRMRVLGYPPGWLQRAKVNTLAIFDGNGEDGELKESSEAVQQYNKEALVEYPGFNTPVPEGVRDDWYMLRMPPMMPTQQLNEALKTMKVSEPVPYKRTKFDISFTSPSTSASTSTPKRTETSDSNSLNKSEPTLNESLSVSYKSEDITTNDSDNCFDDSSEDLLKNNVNKTTPKPSDKPIDENNDSHRKLKLIAMGSPMPVSENTKRPPLEKWAEGMGELLYFENPSTEYTGVYKNKMKGLIDKIRQKHSQT